MRAILRWMPAFAVMAGIFILSSFPSAELPNFGFWDTLVKKGGHVLGYGVLAIALLFGLGWSRQRIPLAFLAAAIYALSDEFHQSFVAGRHASWLDALVIDNLGAGLALLIAWFYMRRSPDKRRQQ